MDARSTIKRIDEARKEQEGDADAEEGQNEC